MMRVFEFRMVLTEDREPDVDEVMSVVRGLLQGVIADAKAQGLWASPTPNPDKDAAERARMN